jgi:prepilin-type N-terminal cleavage/methylation domain-containing protein
MQARNQKGFSLVEAVVALAVASLIALSAAALYRASGQGASQARSSTSQASRVLFEQLRELSSATYVQPVNPGCVSSSCGGNGFHALIRTTDPSAGREFTYQVSYLPQEDGLYRTVDGRNPQKVYPGRGSVIFEFYDANGNRIYSSGTTTWVARVVARAGEGAGSAAATFTMPTGGGGQSAAYSRQIPSSARDDDVVCALVVMSDNHGDFMIWTYIRVSDFPYYTVIEVADTPWDCNDREPIYRGD